MKELLRKKSVKIALLLIILLMATVIIGFTVRSAQRQKEYDNHIQAAEKYLTELDYEQAIAEYILAYEIEPSEEVMDALEQTYLAYAQTYVDTGDYERAISILEEGYAQTGRESLRERMEEVRAEMEAAQRRQQKEEEQRRIEEERRASGMVEFPFSTSDITVMGYSLSENHFANIRALFPTGEGYWMENAYDPTFVEPGTDYSLGYYNIYTSTYADGSGRGTERLDVDNSCEYRVYYHNTDHTSGNTSIWMHSYYTGNTVDSAYFNVPVKPGASYEDWCAVMQIDRIKEYDIRAEQRDGMVGIWNDDYADFATSISDGGEYWLFSTEELKGFYSELNYENGERDCELRFFRPTTWSGVLDWAVSRIEAKIRDGVVDDITYEGFQFY